MSGRRTCLAQPSALGRWIWHCCWVGFRPENTSWGPRYLSWVHFNYEIFAAQNGEFLVYIPLRLIRTSQVPLSLLLDTEHSQPPAWWFSLKQWQDIRKYGTGSCFNLNSTKILRFQWHFSSSVADRHWPGCLTTPPRRRQQRVRRWAGRMRLRSIQCHLCRLAH